MRATQIGGVRATTVAVVAKDLVSRREFVFDKPLIKGTPTPLQSSSMRGPLAVNMVNGKKANVRFPTAFADSPVGFQYPKFSSLALGSALSSGPFDIGFVVSFLLGSVLLIVAALLLQNFIPVLFVVATCAFQYHGRVLFPIYIETALVLLVVAVMLFQQPRPILFAPTLISHSYPVFVQSTIATGLFTCFNFVSLIIGPMIRFPIPLSFETHSPNRLSCGKVLFNKIKRREINC